jgi:hypothetical protein
VQIYLLDVDPFHKSDLQQKHLLLYNPLMWYVQKNKTCLDVIRTVMLYL